MSSSRITRVEGRGLPLAGHDIDTDRILPARFLKTVTFEGLEQHVFEDDRAGRPEEAPAHPFDDPRFGGARILIVNRNFGCGSSREHAPQALRRWGIEAVVGESFSEIFFGNALAIGLVCVKAAPSDVERLQDLVVHDPGARLAVDLDAMVVRAEGLDGEVIIDLPASARDAFVSGTWDATGMLLDDYAAVERTAASLPYVGGRWGSA